MKALLRNGGRSRGKGHYRSGRPRNNPGIRFWNVMYDELLKLELLFRATLEAYADDVAILTTARNAEGAELKLSVVMKKYWNR